MSNNCSSCKFGFKCDFVCVCTRSMTKERYAEFREAAKTMKSDFHKFFKEFIGENLTGFGETCENYRQKISKKELAEKKANKTQKKSDDNKKVVPKTEDKEKEESKPMGLNTAFSNLDKLMKESQNKEESR